MWCQVCVRQNHFLFLNKATVLCTNLRVFIVPPVDHLCPLALAQTAQALDLQGATKTKSAPSASSPPSKNSSPGPRAACSEGVRLSLDASEVWARLFGPQEDRTT